MISVSDLYRTEADPDDQIRGWVRLSVIGNESKFNKVTELDTADSLSTDPIKISNILNTHFSKIEPSLASEIQNTSSNFTDYITPAEQIFKLAEVSCQEVFNLIQEIPSNKASGLDNISARLLKEASPIVTRRLTFIINLSITTGIFPNAWKRARVSPIFKEDLRTDPNNYRPISVLPVVSKLIERVVFDQLYGYLNDNNLLTESQSGFRPMFSTETALLEATNEWLWNIVNNLLNGVMFPDLKKAFDTMDHANLLGKLKLYGVSSQLTCSGPIYRNCLREDTRSPSNGLMKIPISMKLIYFVLITYCQP